MSNGSGAGPHPARQKQHAGYDLNGHHPGNVMEALMCRYPPRHPAGHRHRRARRKLRFVTLLRARQVHIRRNTFRPSADLKGRGQRPVLSGAELLSGEQPADQLQAVPLRHHHHAQFTGWAMWGAPDSLSEKKRSLPAALCPPPWQSVAKDMRSTETDPEGAPDRLEMDMRQCHHGVPSTACVLANLRTTPVPPQHIPSLIQGTNPDISLMP